MHVVLLGGKEFLHGPQEKEREDWRRECCCLDEAAHCLKGFALVSALSLESAGFCFRGPAREEPWLAGVR